MGELHEVTCQWFLLTNLLFSQSDARISVVYNILSVIFTDKNFHETVPWFHVDATVTYVDNHVEDGPSNGRAHRLGPGKDEVVEDVEEVGFGEGRVRIADLIAVLQSLRKSKGNVKIVNITGGIINER